ncbi:Glutamyl-tRNA synthetase [hydrothermal vent metagenome]|uniref:glutamate--tRNA ligase n=1 Tax=hydrothermal vent metagenome TaxID=652676 RepID=A0A3B0RQL6_9ZZZZ
MAATVVTRFPPSPTGFLHIGGARTALFNWLYAKANGGKMVLRIEDTDRQRSTPEAVEAIMDGMNWLELDWDGEPVSQVSRTDRHIEIANQLLATGKAYHCYCSAEELQAMRDKARESGLPIRYDGTWRNRPESDAPGDIKPVLRFKAPQEGQTTVNDQVQGTVTFQNKELDDLILLRSDGTPTYNLSVVVDDHDMGITHIIRGVDHLTNAARQSQIYAALDWSVPVMAHVPLIHGPDGAKLSKRHGALGVDAYRAMGYLPAAMRNYLVRLGWSHGDDEIFSTEQAIEWFGFDAMGKSAARFDFAKLENINGHYIRHMAPQDLLQQLLKALPYLPDGPDFLAALDPEKQQRLLTALPVLRERAKTLIDLMQSASFVVANRPLPLTDKARAILKQGGNDILAQLLPELEAVDDWQFDQLKTLVANFAENNGLKLGKIAPALRAALAGTTQAPGVFDILDLLGRDEALARIRDQK